jgi:hypothetical protein
MLHLSLAGNTLRTVGGTPKLYNPKIILLYLMLMPGQISNLELNLRKMIKENPQTFIDICLCPATILNCMLMCKLQVEMLMAKGARLEPVKYYTSLLAHEQHTK